MAFLLQRENERESRETIRSLKMCAKLANLANVGDIKMVVAMVTGYFDRFGYSHPEIPRLPPGPLASQGT